MHVPSEKTRRDMEAAAELRAAGATWETIGEVLGRKPFVLTRWARVYRDEWRGYLRYAKERALQQVNSEARMKLQALLRHESSHIRMKTAVQYLREQLAENATRRPPDPQLELADFLAKIEKMSDEELQESIAEFIKAARFNPAQGTAP
jgi:hypothetical protein